MPEGISEYQPPEKQQPVTEGAKPGVSKLRRSIRDLIPPRLKGLFTRKQQRPEQQPVPPEPVSSMTEKIPSSLTNNTEHATPVSPDVVFSPEPSINSPQALERIDRPEITSSSDTQHALSSDTPLVPAATPDTRNAQALTTEQNISPIHPDIEEGAKHVLEKKLVESVKIGSPAGIESSIQNLADAWNQAQKAAGSTFELTPEGKQVIPERVKEICAQHLQEGLTEIYKATEFGIQQGWEHSITYEPERLAKLLDVAEEFQIPLTYVPPTDNAPASSNLPAVTINNRDQALTYMQEIIDRNLPRGVQSLVRVLGSQVGQGLLKELPSYEGRIERWIAVMQQRGWSVVDQPTQPIMGEEKPGLLTRQVNRAEVRQIIDQAVRDNLAKGAKHISHMVGHVVKSGFFDPLATWGSPQNIALYTEAGQHYGLTHQRSATTEQSGVNPDMFFDPTQLPEQVKQAVRENLPEGLKTIQQRHLKNIRSGNADQIEFADSTLEQYIGLATEYGVSANADQLRSTMAAHLTVENLNEGVRTLTTAVRDAIRKANYLAVSVASREAEIYRRFIYKRGFEGKIDFSELDRYLQETATQSPRLTEKTT